MNARKLTCSDLSRNSGRPGQLQLGAQFGAPSVCGMHARPRLLRPLPDRYESGEDEAQLQ